MEGSHHALAEWPKEAVSYDKDQLIRAAIDITANPLPYRVVLIAIARVRVDLPLGQGAGCRWAK